jgi:hypothetical protein
MTEWVSQSIVALQDEVDSLTSVVHALDLKRVEHTFSQMKNVAFTLTNLGWSETWPRSYKNALQKGEKS